ncbi:hypothetical protein [Streptomyces malaysiensis]
MANSRLYPFWGSLTEALRTGKPQNEHKYGGDVFDAIYRDQEGLAADGRAWMAEAGFRGSWIEPLTDGYSMLVGIK